MEKINNALIRLDNNCRTIRQHPFIPFLEKSVSANKYPASAGIYIFRYFLTAIALETVPSTIPKIAW